MSNGADIRARVSGRSEVTGMTEDMRTHAPPPTPAPAPGAATPVEPIIDPHVCDGMSHKELHELRKQGGYAKRDAESIIETRLSPMDQIDRKRARRN